jgi:uncharacterized protein (DUF2147 family)
MVYQPAYRAPMTRFATGAVGALASLICATAATAASVEGLWIDDKGQGAIELTPCGRKFCGRIAWLKEPTDPTGRPPLDSLNPNPAKRALPICGLQIVGGLERQPDGTFDAGWIYDPKVGKSYDLAVEIKDSGHLVIIGYQGVRFLNQKFIWSRAPVQPPLPKCAPVPG